MILNIYEKYTKGKAFVNGQIQSKMSIV